jgi:hypothetical protein
MNWSFDSCELLKSGANGQIVFVISSPLEAMRDFKKQSE